MWLPTPFYEKAPHYWLLLGLLFTVLGIYLGVQVQPYYMYGGVTIGIGCCAWGAHVFAERAKNRRVPQPEEHTQQAEPPKEASD